MARRCGGERSWRLACLIYAAVKERTGALPVSSIHPLPRLPLLVQQQQQQPPTHVPQASFKAPLRLYQGTINDSGHCLACLHTCACSSLEQRGESSEAEPPLCSLLQRAPPFILPSYTPEFSLNRAFIGPV